MIIDSFIWREACLFVARLSSILLGAGCLPRYNVLSVVETLSTDCAFLFSCTDITLRVAQFLTPALITVMQQSQAVQDERLLDLKIITDVRRLFFE